MQIGRAITPAPAATAQAVDAPQIRELLSLRTGRLIDAPSLIRRHRYDAVIRLRNMVLELMKAKRPRLVCSLCGVAGIPFPEYSGDSDLERWLRMVFTAQTGVPEGWNYKTLPEVAHHLHDQFPGRLLPFFRMLNQYETADLLKAQDITGNWDAKALRTRDELKAGSTRYVTTCEWDTLLAFLFPELFHVFFRIS